jgi:hypothetical protein
MTPKVEGSGIVVPVPELYEKSSITNEPPAGEPVITISEISAKFNCKYSLGLLPGSPDMAKLLEKAEVV